MFRKRSLLVITAIFCLQCGTGTAQGQESSSRPQAQAGSRTGTDLQTASASDAASAALRDLLAAACAHDETSFEKFLTTRNIEAFSRLTPAARVELMKRFVLLDAAGKPTLSANPAGRPAIRCATPDGAAEIQLGGVDLRENVALLPLDIRDVSELPSGEPHHILMGLVRENSFWKILSIGMLFLDLPSLEIEWDQSAIGSNQHQALASLKLIAAAVETYRKTYSRLPESLSKLGPAPKPSLEAAGLLDADLVTGQDNGYAFRMVIVGANSVGAPAQYELSAVPVIYGRTGKLSFFRDVNGKFHAADRQGAVGHLLDPGVE